MDYCSSVLIMDQEEAQWLGDQNTSEVDPWLFTPSDQEAGHCSVINACTHGGFPTVNQMGVDAAKSEWRNGVSFGNVQPWRRGL